MSKIYLEEQRNKTNTWSQNPSATKYPTEALVKGSLDVVDRINAIQQREIDNLKESLAETTTITYPDNTYQKGTVPSDVCKFAQINNIIGVSKKTKNLFNPTLATTTLNGVTCTKNADNTYTVSGTSTDLCVFFLGNCGFVNGTQYKLLGFSGTGIQDRFCLYVNGQGYPNDLGNGVTFTATSSSSTSIRLNIPPDTTVNMLLRPMITTDTSATYADYEPYFEGIKSATITKVTEVKNLLEPTLQTTTTNNVKCTANGDGTFTLTSTNGQPSSATTYFALLNTTIKRGIYKLIGFNDMNKGYLVAQNGVFAEGATINLLNDFTGYIYLCVFANRQINNLVIKPMLTTDLTATYADFVKHEVHELALPEPIQLRSAGTVADEYTPITGVIDRNINRVKLKDLNWGYQGGDGYPNMFSVAIPDTRTNTTVSENYIFAICGKYICKGTGYRSTIANYESGTFIVGAGQTTYYFKDTNYTDATAFKNHFTDDDYLCYQLATPTTEQVTPINPFIQCEGGGQLSLTHTESPATESRFVVEFANKQ